KERRLEGAAAATIGARYGPAEQERAGLEAEDVVDARRDVGRELEQGAEAAQQLVDPLPGGEADRAVVLEDDRWRQRGGEAIEVGRRDHRRDRACGRR